MYGHSAVIKGRILISIFLNFTITIAEIIGGLLSGSVALLSDSIHNLGDSMGLVASYGAIKIGERERDEKYTFGYRRAEILVAFGNSAALLAISLLLIYESYQRFLHPNPIHGPLMLGVALVGLTGNFLSILLLHSHARESINVKSAYLHLLSDTLSSVAVVTGALLLIIFQVLWIDPLISVLIAVYIIYEGFDILKESIEVLMEASPNMDFQEIKRVIESIEGVKNAHHFHVWRIGEKDIIFECHVEVEDMPISQAQNIIDRIGEKLKGYGITHVTIQLESDRCRGRNIICRDDES